ncbi:MAG: DUF4142 domain-containing protein [Bacteroidia bacterium]
MHNRNLTASSIQKTVLFFVLILNFTACKQSNNNKPEDSKDIANKFNKAKFDNSKEAAFLVDATEICYEELEIARLAQSNATNENIKEIGKMMEKDNTVFLEEIKKLAESKNITIPSEITTRGQNERKKLSVDSGQNFDKNYCDMAVENNKKAVKKYMSAVEDCEDVDVKNWATKSLIVLRNHLDHAMTCAEAYKENKNQPAKAIDRDMKEIKSHPAAKTQTTTNNNSH